MLIIKLDAIDSTNDYLKALAKKQVLENFTTVTANYQTKGKGQMGAKWLSEPGKNLTMSVLLKDVLVNNSAIFNLNVAVALSIITVLDSMNISKVSIKWPNDIMADTKKIGGILIENSLKSGGTITSIIGIGLNVNQTDFSQLPKASSLVLETKQEQNREDVAQKILEQLQLFVAMVNTQPDFLWQRYHERLFKNGIPMAFEAANGNQFMGIIQHVSLDGQLHLLLEDDTTQSYSVKEIKMLF